MRNLLLFIVLLVACVVAVGYYREWFTVSKSGNDRSIDINVKVDKDKVKEDEDKAKDKIKEVGGNIRDQAGSLTKKNPKEADDKNPDDKPR